MVKNKDMKKELQNAFDSFFQKKDEEKLIKELKNNLEIFFKIIEDLYGKNFHHNESADKFLEEFSPWHHGGGQELIEKFVDNVKKDNSTNDFSWLDILDEDKQWKEQDDEEIKKEVKDKRKHVNMRYQIPTHFHGDIDNAVIFHCMENPRGYLGDWSDDDIDKEFKGENLNEFYIYSAEKRKEKSNVLEEIIKERYKLQNITYNSIEKLIYSYDKKKGGQSPLAIELDRMFKKFKDPDYKIYDFSKGSSDLKDYYYFKNYYKQLILGDDNNLKLFKIKENRDKAIKCADKICNLEIYPFSCAQPDLDKNGIGVKIIQNSELSRLSAYIVLRRIYKYLDKCKKSKIKNEEEPEKPVFVFRKYNRAWEQLFKALFSEVKKENCRFENRKTRTILEQLFFYCQTGNAGGGITSGNVISIKNYENYQKIFQILKETSFEEIYNILHRSNSLEK